uniref:Uncharacterized protein n=1 Tax=Staphylococcus epidermidis TaxID=1282 RepID=A0A6B9V1D3_STAEP|nr:hypothetical protein [Staphylococcus epidermidis]
MRFMRIAVMFLITSINKKDMHYVKYLLNDIKRGYINDF